MAPQPPLGIIAGGGVLPGRVAAAAQAAGRQVFLVGLEGYADPAVLAPFPHGFARLGAVGSIRALLRNQGCTELVLIGAVRRPSLTDLRPDTEGVRLLARIGRAAFAGDDGLLAAIVRILREDGFAVRGAQEILHAALAPAGLLSRAAPDAQAMADISRGLAVLGLLGAADIGQACVVQQGIVLAVEAAEGTDAMIARAGTLARPGARPVLVKRAKPGQDRRVDLPTIGPATIAAAAAAGLAGLACEAGSTLIADRAGLLARADETGLFVLGLDPQSLTGEPE